jgi:signal transduction histidine kinase
MVERLRLTLLALVVALVSALGFVPVALTGAAIPLIVIWVGLPLLIAATALSRWFAAAGRHAAGRVRRPPIVRPYREFAGSGFFSRSRWLLTDPATWRDLLWLGLNATAGVVLSALPVVLLLGGLTCVVYPLLIAVTPAGIFDEPFGQILRMQHWREGFVMWLLAAALLVCWWTTVHGLTTAWSAISGALLGPTRAEALAGHVQSLALSRADTRDSAAAEIRRIERDLHDGVQVRLVSMGMTLGLANELVDENPERARELIAEASETTSETLAELRTLIRGIHPPLLADRGLVGAARALAMQAPITAEITVNGFGDREQVRLPAPVEACTYFVVAEAMTNALRHSGADNLGITLDLRPGILVANVRDDGRGGADIDRGSGLYGVSRRLAAFDGTLRVTSPPGGPTDIWMEIPCEPLSPRTTPSYEKA